MFVSSWMKLGECKILSLDERMPAAAGCCIDEGTPQKVCLSSALKQASNLSWMLDTYG
jgi:hypothetical protein